MLNITLAIWSSDSVIIVVGSPIQVKQFISSTPKFTRNDTGVCRNPALMMGQIQKYLNFKSVLTSSAYATCHNCYLEVKYECCCRGKPDRSFTLHPFDSGICPKCFRYRNLVLRLMTIRPQ